jgi:hypothetical protein
LGRVTAKHTSFPNFGKAEYIFAAELTHGLGALPDGQRKISWSGRRAGKAQPR